MAYAGDRGSFEIPDQVKWMQSLAPMMAGLASGKEAVAEIGASLQIAKIGAGSTDEAANNFKTFLPKFLPAILRNSLLIWVLICRIYCEL